MSKTQRKQHFLCTVCQHEEPKWLGRCPECGSWNSFEESVGKASGQKGRERADSFPTPLSSIQTKETLRLDSGTEEMNRVLGGGIMKGSVTLLAGEPGIGKSTLMLQLVAGVQSGGRTLYISGEESPAQIRLRADRLGIQSSRIEVYSETELSALLRVCENVKPVVVVLDSIQTVYSEDIGSVPGTVNQIKLCAQELIDWAKSRAAALFLVGHVTKEGYIAGPKVVEHMVDTVLYFDSGSAEIRILHCAKNRFGSVDEIGIFEMGERGLQQVDNPASVFLSHRVGEQPPGVAVAPVYEGSRILLVEIQSLAVPAKGGISRVFSERIDTARVSRMAAVLEKHLKVRFSDQDIYVNVGGGIRISEVGVDLPLCLSLYSARINQPIPPLTAIVGEISLAGEVHPVGYLDRRLKAVQEMGFSRLISPPPKEKKLQLPDFCFPVSSLAEAARSGFQP
ncbi:MAG: DNA repair protein RadA [Spirochaetaceae bacterium]|nr:MAG: DNA repair protein RadA [Spirochaetaceae bacterium]